MYTQHQPLQNLTGYSLVWMKGGRGAHISNLLGTVNLTSHNLQLRVFLCCSLVLIETETDAGNQLLVTDSLGSLGSLLSVGILITFTAQHRLLKGGEPFLHDEPGSRVARTRGSCNLESPALGDQHPTKVPQPPQKSPRPREQMFKIWASKGGTFSEPNYNGEKV